MSKITSSSTKPEILEALAKTKKEQGILHTEITTLNSKIEGLEILGKEKNDAILELEALVQEEDVKKESLIKELARQATDMEIQSQKNLELSKVAKEQGETLATLDSVKKELETVQSELFAANKKVDLLTTELAGLKSRALPPASKKGRFFKSFWKTAAVCSVIVFVIVAMAALNVDEDPDVISFIKYDNGIIAASHDPNVLTLKSEDGGDLEIGGVDVSVAKWAKEAGYTGIIYGEIIKMDDGEIVLAGADKFNYDTVNIDKLTSKFEELDCYDILALVDNPENVVLPSPFTSVSQGELKFYEGRRKLAGIVPVFWGKDKRVLHISSDNITGFISSTGIFMDDGIIKDFVPFEVVETEEDSSEVAGVAFDKIKEWKENVKNLW